MNYRTRDRMEAESVKRIQEAQKIIDDRFLARIVRLPPIEVRMAQERNRSFLEKMGDIDHLLNNAIKSVGRKIRQKLDMENELDLVHRRDNIPKTDKKYYTQFNFRWDTDYSQELQMNILEGLKQKYFNWCAEHTYEEIMELGRPNWWGMPLEEQHRNSPDYIDKILEQASINIEDDLYQYRCGYMFQTEWIDTTYGDLDGGPNGEPPYLDPARCKAEGRIYRGPDLNNPRNAYQLTGPGILYNTRLYNEDGSLTHVEPLPQFHFITIGSLETQAKIDVLNSIEFRKKEVELEEQGVLDPKDRLPSQWGVGEADNFYRQVKLPFEGSEYNEVKNHYDLDDIIEKRKEIKKTFRLGTANPIPQTKGLKGVRSREYDNNVFHNDYAPSVNTNQRARDLNLPDYVEVDEYGDFIAEPEDLGMPNLYENVNEPVVDEAEILQALGQCLPDEYDSSDPMAIERLRARLRRENEDKRLHEIEKERELESKDDSFDELERLANETLGVSDYFNFENFSFDLDNKVENEIEPEVEPEPVPRKSTEVKVTSSSILEESDFVEYVEYNMSAYKKELLETLPTSGPGEVFRVLQKFRGYAFCFHDGRFINEMKNKGTVDFNVSSNRRNRFKSRKFLKDEIGYFPVFMLIADGKLLDDYEYFLKTYNKCIPTGAKFLFVSDIKDDDIIIDANKWQDLERYIDTSVDNNGVSSIKSISDLEYVERGDAELILRKALNAEDVLEIYDVAI